MVPVKKPEEKKPEDEINKSTGNETEDYSNALEDDVDKLINDVYHPEDEGDEDKDDDKPTDDGKEGEDDDTGDSDKDDGEVDDKDDKDGDDEEDGKEDLATQLEKANKRVKDTRAEFTKKSQELSTVTKKTQELEDTIFSLRSKVEELSKAQQTKTEEKKTEKSIQKDSLALEEKMEAIKAVDPDLAKALEPIVGGLVSEVNNLKNELKTTEEKWSSKAEKDAHDAHFGKIDKAHDGWEDTMKSPEFKEYLDDLKPREKRLALLDLQDGTADQIIEVFDDFKSSQKPNDDDTSADDKKKAKLKKAKEMSGPNLKKSKEFNRGVQNFKYTRSEIDAMDETEYAEKEADIDKAMSEGLIANQ
jgi:hypothetical protein